MSNIFIIGATGGIGSRLIPLLVEKGHTVTGLHRAPDQADALRRAGINPCFGDIKTMSTDGLSKATQGSDVIVYSAGAAGSGLDRTSAIDGEGVIKTINAAVKNGTSRIYLVSAFMDALRDQPQTTGFEYYMKIKRQADVALVASRLDWVILRPGTLTNNEDGDGLVNADLAVPYGNVARRSVAAVLAELIDTPSIQRKIIELTDGITPVQDAIKTLMR